MLVFIENTPRAYAWGSRDALPDLLGLAPTGEPQAELWLGTHPADPSEVSRATERAQTLIDLVQGDPDSYGVNGGPLPFLLKVLAIGAPLSLQVHPNREQAAAGFAAEEAAGVPCDARERNYGDANHKPELLVALSEVRALSGFRPLDESRHELLLLAARAREAELTEGAEALEQCAARLRGADPGAVRREFLSWVFSGDEVVDRCVAALAAIVGHGAGGEDWPPRERLAVLDELGTHHPGDPGALVSLLLHLVHLAPGEAIYLRARQLHAYLGGIAVEVMAASDNVLRAGLTQKHVDIAELRRIVDTSELDEPRFAGVSPARGVVEWRPDIPDFALVRVRVSESGEVVAPDGSAPEARIAADHPVLVVVTAGRVRVERGGDGPAEPALAEVATARRGQSLYVSAGAPITLTGHGEAFLATVGRSPTAD